MNVQDNIYAHARNQVVSTYNNRVSCDDSGLALVIYTDPLSDAARNALEKSFAAIGFDADAQAFACVKDLAAERVFDIVEGIDPLVLVASDTDSAQRYAQAVRADFPLMRKVRVFGREARAFHQLNAMMDDDADKQAVWHLLKSLA
jgi:hypothetical protein